MADKNVQLKSGNDNLFPLTKVGNVSGAIGYEEVVSGFSVTVNNAGVDTITVYDGTDNTGEPLGTVADRDSDTFTITSGYIFAYGDFPISVDGATGGVTATNPATVSGNGTWIVHTEHGSG